MKLDNPPPPEYVFKYHEPPKSGNITNGLGESEVRRATRVFHWPFGKPPHHWQALDLHFNLIGGMGGPYMGYGMIWQRLWNLWQIRRANGPVARKRREVADPKAMAGEIKAYIQRHFTESIVGITRVVPTDIVEGESVDFEYVICVGQPMERDIMLQVPQPAAGWEVMRGYRRVSKQAVKLAAHIRGLGWGSQGPRRSQDRFAAPYPAGDPRRTGRARQARLYHHQGMGLQRPAGRGHHEFAAGRRRSGGYRRRRPLRRLPAVHPRLSAGRDHGQQADGPGRGEMVRRFRQVRTLLRRELGLRHLYRGVSVGGTGPGPETVRNAARQTAEGRLRR